MSRSPAKASDPIMPGAKREPSSFIQATTDRLARRLYRLLGDGLHRLERRQDAEGAVELAAGRLAVRDGCRQDGGASRSRPVQTQEQIARGIRRTRVKPTAAPQPMTRRQAAISPSLSA